MKTFPVTFWSAPIGVGDGIDMASRNYLRALSSTGYENVIIQPYGTLAPSPEIEDLRPLMSYPKQYRFQAVRVQAGDPRIGKKWPHLDGGTVPPPPGAPAGSLSFEWDVRIREGDYDHDYYREHPEALQDKWTPHCEAMVLHYDPGRLARARDAVARDTGGEVPLIGITAWETDAIPLSTAQQLSDFDALIVPSLHTKRALENGSIDPDCPITVIPHHVSVPPPFFNQSKKDPDRFYFYTVGTNIPRKNLSTLIKAYLLAFAPDFREVGLIVKTSGTKSMCAKLVDDVVEELGLVNPPKIVVIGERLSDEMMRALHWQADCFVSATRGEGFGLGEAEATVVGNPVITTNWGACPEFCTGYVDDETYYFGVDYDLVPVEAEMAKYGVYKSEQMWADPKIDSLVEAMRQVKLAEPRKSPARRAAATDRLSKKWVGVRIAGALRNVIEGFEI